MVLAEGGSLRGWLGKNQSNEKRLKEGLEFFKQACMGIRAIHDAGLVHMDVKPENILLVDGKAKVTDFGIGRFGGGRFAENPEQVYRQGIGTPRYMSPEQFRTARQKDIGPASDIYSLGIVFYELLDGQPPFDGSAVELREKHLNMNPPQLKGTNKDWWRLVERCLRKNPDERYPSVSQMARDLERIAQGASLLVDVSCPQCGHINSDLWMMYCEKCDSSIAQRFHPCHRCARDVRIDNDICKCGANVGAYYQKFGNSKLSKVARFQ